MSRVERNRVGAKLVRCAFALALSACAAEVVEGGGASDEAEASANEQALTRGSQGYAYVVDGLASSRSWSSTDQPITVAKPGVGRYTVTFNGLGPALGAPGGIAEVVAVGSDNVRCKLGTYSRNAIGHEVVDVRCWNPAAVPPALTDSKFVVKYGREDPALSTGAYVWANQPSNASYDPGPGKRWNPAGPGGTVRIDRTGTGKYEVFFFGLSDLAATYEVTALGSTPDHCKFDSAKFITSEDALKVVVFCYGATDLIDSQFTLNVVHDVGLLGQGARAWADQPTATSYTPKVPESYNSTSYFGRTGALTASRSLRGTYKLALEDIRHVNAAPFVGARAGANGNYCKIASWLASTLNAGWMDVNVKCYTSNGGATTDQEYVATYFVPFPLE